MGCLVCSFGNSLRDQQRVKLHEVSFQSVLASWGFILGLFLLPSS